uniref:Gastrin/cholecystokinin peptide hormone domain-containing protein n=1 Tax=Monopterus albus TaxID=43700 RepID=A0A3Q3KB58_MONAL
MTAGPCVCIILAVLCTSCLGLPFSSQPPNEGQHSLSALSEALLEADIHTLGEPHLRHSRSAPQLKALPLADEDAESRANLGELLARLISSRKGVCVCVCMCVCGGGCKCASLCFCMSVLIACVWVSSLLYLHNVEDLLD